jgi:hypothetical protein
MKYFLFSITSLVACLGFSQNGYWQQHVGYTIDAILNDGEAKLSGEEKIIYTNNSPDAIKEIYFHLYWNAFSKGSHAFEKMDIDPKTLNQSDYGSIVVSNVLVNGETAELNVFESIGQLKLGKPLNAGEKIEIKLDFNAVIPKTLNRAGKNNTAGTDYTFTQWYPKICRYDKQGWHTDPYLGREFAGTFGTFDVNISCDAAFTVAGTGTPKNKLYTSDGWKNVDGSAQASGLVNWEFHAENVHDFAWAADKDWAYQKKTIDGIDFQFFYGDYNIEDWDYLIENWETAYSICKDEFGIYPYPQFSFIQGGEGYMEYPMCTMLEESRSDFFNTACHEFMHNYFYGIYGSDENLHHWMDEGITCYAEARISNIYNNEIYPARDAYSSYSWMRMITTEEPVATAANHFVEDYAYYNAAYYKGQLFPEMIRYLIGDNTMKAGFAKYYETWKFKHPEPNDFVKVFEDVSGMELTWFQNYWLNTTHTIDLTLGEIVKRSGGIELTIERVGVPVPVELEVILKNGSKRYFYVPLNLTNNIKRDFNRPTELLPTWSSATNSFEVLIPVKYKEIESITIDPNQILPDVNEEGNVKILE